MRYKFALTVLAIMYLAHKTPHIHHLDLNHHSETTTLDLTHHLDLNHHSEATTLDLIHHMDLTHHSDLNHHSEATTLDLNNHLDHIRHSEVQHLSNHKTLMKTQSNLLKTKVLHLPHPKKHILGIDASQMILLLIAVISQFLLLILKLRIIVISFTHGKLRRIKLIAHQILSYQETKFLLANLYHNLTNLKTLLTTQSNLLLKTQSNLLKT